MRTYRGLTPEDLDRMPVDRFLSLVPWGDMRGGGRSGSSNGRMSKTEAAIHFSRQSSAIDAALEDLLDP